MDSSIPPSGPGGRRKRRPGLWTAIGNDLRTHRRAMQAGRAMGTWLWMSLHTASEGLDGFVPREAIRLAWVSEREALADIAILVKVGLLTPSERSDEPLPRAATDAGFARGWWVDRYTVWNGTAEEIRGKREASTARTARSRNASGPKSWTNEYEDLTSCNALRTAHVTRDVRRTYLRSTLRDQDLDLVISDPNPTYQDSHTRVGASAREADSTLLPPPPPSPHVDAPQPSSETAPLSSFAAEDGPADIPPDIPTAESILDAPPIGRGLGANHSVEQRTSTLNEPIGLEPVRRRPRPIGVRRFEQGYYTQAFAVGVAEVTGGAYVVARDELSALDDAIDTHGPEGPGPHDTWLRDSVAAFRRAIWGRETYHRAGGPKGWRDWLNLGSPSAEWLAMTPAQREAAAEEEKRRARAKARARRERAERAAEEAVEPAEPAELAEGYARILAGLSSSASQGKAK